MKTLTFAEFAEWTKELWPQDCAQRHVMHRAMEHLEHMDPQMGPDALVGLIHSAQIQRVFELAKANGATPEELTVMRDVEEALAVAVGGSHESGENS